MVNKKAVIKLYTRYNVSAFKYLKISLKEISCILILLYLIVIKYMSYKRILGAHQE